MHTNIQTTNPFSIPTAGQLEKIHSPTPKPVPAKDLTVERQPEQKPHTLRHAGGTFDFGHQMPYKNRHFKLHKKAENDFIKAVPLLFDHLENTAVVFHNTDYVSEVFECYNSFYAHLFLDWVKAFAIIRKAEREEIINYVIQSSDDDFLSAFRLFKWRSIKPIQKRTITLKQKVWNAIKQHFPDKPFTSTDLQDRTLISRENIHPLLQEFKEQGKLKQCRKLGRHYRYELI